MQAAQEHGLMGFGGGCVSKLGPRHSLATAQPFPCACRHQAPLRSFSGLPRRQQAHGFPQPPAFHWESSSARVGAVPTCPRLPCVCTVPGDVEREAPRPRAMSRILLIPTVPQNLPIATVPIAVAGTGRREGESSDQEQRESFPPPEADVGLRCSWKVCTRTEAFG